MSTSKHLIIIIHNKLKSAWLARNSVVKKIKTRNKTTNHYTTTFKSFRSTTL